MTEEERLRREFEAWRRREAAVAARLAGARRAVRWVYVGALALGMAAVLASSLCGVAP